MIDGKCKIIKFEPGWLQYQLNQSALRAAKMPKWLTHPETWYRKELDRE